MNNAWELCEFFHYVFWYTCFLILIVLSLSELCVLNSFWTGIGLILAGIGLAADIWQTYE